MSPCKRKIWYSNNCLDFFKVCIPLLSHFPKEAKACTWLFLRQNLAYANSPLLIHLSKLDHIIVIDDLACNNETQRVSDYMHKIIFK